MMENYKLLYEEAKRVLDEFEYPKVTPKTIPKARHWKEKYKKLMESKIRLERERNKTFKLAQKLIKVLEQNDIKVDLSEFGDILGANGVPLIHANTKINNINYGPFNNIF